MRVLTGALFVVVTDDRGIRLAHPDPAQLGLLVSTDPSVALAGGEEVVEQRGTLGDSARAKVPVLAPDGSAVVGAVSVGIGTDEISAALWADLRVAALYAAAALGLGVLASVLLNRRLRRLTLGVEPEELAGMAVRAPGGSRRDQRGGLRGRPRTAGSGWRTRRRNGCSARRAAGAEVAGAGMPRRLVELISDVSGRPVASRTTSTPPFLVLAGERVLVCTVGGVTRDGHDLGVVVSARDRTDIEA